MGGVAFEGEFLPIPTLVFGSLVPRAASFFGYTKFVTGPGILSHMRRQFLDE